MIPDVSTDTANCSQADKQNMTIIRRARWATSALFLMDGMTFGTWAALIPSFQHTFDLSAGALSGVLAGLVVGALISMPLAGRLIAICGSRRVAYISGVAFPSTLMLLALAPNYGLLIAAAIVFGACKGGIDVSVNAQGITVENAAHKPIFSSFQAFWSFGGLIAAFLVSTALHRGVSASVLLFGMAGLLLLLTLATLGKLLPEPSSKKVTQKRKSISFRLPNARLLKLGALGFLALFSEGVLLDWSAVYAHGVGNVSLATAPIAFAAFQICMASSRAVGDTVVAKFGSVRTMRISGLLMILGMAIAVAFHFWPTILAGFMLVGFGIANLVPIIFGAAGRAHEDGAGPGVATVTTLGYTGFLCGPPIIGALAVVAGLPASFCVVILFGFILATVGAANVKSKIG